jgi:hypothetical protein
VIIYKFSDVTVGNVSHGLQFVVLQPLPHLGTLPLCAGTLTLGHVPLLPAG